MPIAASVATPDAAPPTRSLWRWLARHPLVWLAGLCVLVSGCGLALMLNTMRLQQIAASQQALDALTRVIEEQTARTLQAVQARLEVASDALQHLDQRRALNPASAQAVVIDQIKDLPFVSSMWVLDDRGRLIGNTLEDRAGYGADFSDRDYFQALCCVARAILTVGKTTPGNVLKRWRMPVARALRGADGSFRGVVSVGIEPEYFEALWSSVDLGEGYVVSLFHRDNTLMMRSPLRPAELGARYPQMEVFKPPHAGQPQGRFLKPSAIDGKERYFAYRGISTRPELLLVVGQSSTVILAPWRRMAVLVTALWVLASGVIVGLSLYLQRARQRHASAERQASDISKRLELATQAASIGVWDWDLRTDLAYASPPYYTMLGYPPEDGVVDRASWLERVHPDDAARAGEHMAQALAGQVDGYELEIRMRHADGQYRWVALSGRVTERDDQGRPVRMMGVRLDTSARHAGEEALKALLQDKDALLREVHHRVKNNLQVISSLLRLEAGRDTVPATRSVLRDMQGRIQAMALLHETLFGSGKFARVDLGKYLRQLARQAFTTLSTRSDGVTLRLELAEVDISMDQAITCGLLVNELVSNALKHGFPNQAGGEISIELAGPDADGLLRLRVADTGIGLPQDFARRQTESLGLQLASDLAGQLGGELEVGPLPLAAFVVSFRPDRRA